MPAEISTRAGPTPAGTSTITAMRLAAATSASPPAARMARALPRISALRLGSSTNADDDRFGRKQREEPDESDGCWGITERAKQRGTETAREVDADNESESQLAERGRPAARLRCWRAAGLWSWKREHGVAVGSRPAEYGSSRICLYCRVSGPAWEAHGPSAGLPRRACKRRLSSHLGCWPPERPVKDAADFVVRRRFSRIATRARDFSSSWAGFRRGPTWSLSTMVPCANP